MKRTHAIVRLALIMTMLMVAMSMAIQPAAAQVTIASATLHIYSDYVSGSSAEVRVHRVTASWDESTVTWGNFGGSFDSSVAASFASGSGWLDVDVTALVQAWVDGTHPNYGLLLEQGSMTGYTRYFSSEYSVPAERPKLEICYSSGVCKTIQRGTLGEVADAYIWELYPDANSGSSERLYTGDILEKEKRSLLWFDVPEVPSGGCTPGFWQGRNNGRLLWNDMPDPDFDPEYDNPYDTGMPFEDFFPASGTYVDGLAMIDLVGTGGGKDDVRKAARSLVAAYLNASHTDVNYPETTGDLMLMWSAAVAGGTFLDLHIELDGYNNLGCSID